MLEVFLRMALTPAGEIEVAYAGQQSSVPEQHSPKFHVRFSAGMKISWRLKIGER
jgi:hypothetical protein